MAHPELQTLRYDVQDGIATITLHRPEKLNAFTVQMRDELIATFDRTDADDAVRVVIVTGAGRAFCAGADLSSGGKTFDYAKRGDAERDAHKVGEVYRDGGGMVTLRMFKSLKPVIGAINGAAVGIGMTMQLPMDIRLASAPTRASASCSHAAASRPRRRRAGSCRAWWACRRRWSGASPAACSTPHEALARGLVRSAACPGRAAARGACTGARDRRQHRAGVGGADAADAVAHGRPPTTR